MAEKFSIKRPVRKDYIDKYGFEGDGIWRWELLKYNEAKLAWERRQANMKDFHKREAAERKRQKDIAKSTANSKSKTVKKTSTPKKNATVKKQVAKKKSK